MCPRPPGNMSFGNSPHGGDLLSCLSIRQVLGIVVPSAAATIGHDTWLGHKEGFSSPGFLLELPSRQANLHEMFLLINNDQVLN